MILNEQSWLFWIYLDIGVCSQPVYSGTNPQIKTWHLLPFGLGASYPKLLWKLECVGPPNENLHEICILDKWKRRSHNIGALWTPPVRLRARKISAVYYDLTYPKATMLPQLLVSLPLRLSLKFSHWIKSPPPSTHESWMKIFKLSPSLKGLAEEIMPTGGGVNSYLFLLKGRTKGTSHRLQALLDYKPWNEMKFNRSYESICIRFWRFPKTSFDSKWNSPERTIGKFGNFPNPTQMLSYNGMDNRPLHLANTDVAFAKFSLFRSFVPGCPRSFIDFRTGLNEWMMMAWMWSTHDNTPSIHNASVAWTSTQRNIHKIYTICGIETIAVVIGPDMRRSTWICREPVGHDPIGCRSFVACGL